MTNEEVIEELSVLHERLSYPEDCENGCYSFRDGNYTEALDMAIKMLDEQLTIKSEQRMVRCRDCKYNVANMRKDTLDATDYSDITCSYFMTDGMEADDFCSRGETE